MRSNRWVTLVLVLLTTGIGMSAFGSAFPLLPLWIKDLGIGRGQASLISAFWYLPGMVISLPAGWLFDRYPVRRTLLLCWVLVFAGMALMTVAPSFWLLCAGRLLFSIGMNAHMIGAPKLLGQAFQGRKELGWVMGVYTMSFTGGIWFAFNVLGPLAAESGWRAATQLVAGLSIAGLVLVFLMPSLMNTAEVKPASTRFNPIALGVGAWILSIAYAGYSFGTEALLTFGPDALVSRGVAVAVASAAVGSYAVIALILKPILATRLTPNSAFLFATVASALGVVATVLFLFPTLPLKVAPAVLGVSLALGMPAFLALPSFLFPPDRSGRCYGLYQALYSLGFFLQPLVGVMVDITGTYSAGFLVVIGYCLLGFLVLVPAVRRARSA